ncbi:glutamine ABC superfamily ATP binding cassette transporter, substrate binding protein [Lactiplantibacillus fabifermentans DSM 21115]|uniref:Glutamine ABC superfamily ATP binding cassette transporter, substrate binding protein n=1 Tax=Lactiplantibacillus fabifermentans DSM 21115 TaxID=1413187 RepID=A0A0R2N8W6_9LACO|nr:glutamine ABC superfamily ATP binding cassette transporter, substrate binding protein [Lactiplantibacillus fabifermentans DSM 21115]
MLVGLAGTLSGCENVKTRADTQDTWAKIKKRGYVIVGLDDSFVPMGFREKSGKLVGYDVDLARAVFKLYGIKISFQTIDWSMNATELRNGTIDLIWNGYTKNAQREKVVAFSNTYLKNKQVLVSLKKNHINSFNDMTGKTLGVQSGSSGYESLENNPTLLKNKIANKTPIQYDTFTNAFLDLNAGRIKGLLIDSVYANYYIKHESNSADYNETQGTFKSEDFAVGMRKGDKTMRKKINAGLKELKANGTLAKINKKWFGNQKVEN